MEILCRVGEYTAEYNVLQNSKCIKLLSTLPTPEITANTVLISPHTEVSILSTAQQSYSLSTYPPWKRFPASEFDKQPADTLALRVLM